MQNLVIYLSKYGSTKQYAEWIAAETGFTPVSKQQVTAARLKEAEIIILGSYVMAHVLKMHPWIKAKWEILQNKKLVIYSVSGEPPNPKYMQEILEKSFPAEMREKFKFFSFPGRFVWGKLGWLDNLIMKIFVKTVKDEKKKAALLGDYDGVQKENIKELVNYVKGL